MQEAGVGFVTLGVFSWALLQPEPDRYDFGWFDEVLPPRITPTVPNPTHELDFARFSSDELLDHYRAEQDVLRRHSPNVPVTTNLMVSSHQSEQDYFRWAPELDLIAQDHYLDARLAHPRAGAGLHRRPDPWGRGQHAVAADGIVDVGGELAAGQRGEAAR